MLSSSCLGAVLIWLVSQIVAPCSRVAVRRSLAVSTAISSVGIASLVASTVGVVVVGLADRCVSSGHGQLLGVVEVLLAAKPAGLATRPVVVGSAAANGEHPEEGGGDGESGTDPNGCQEVRVDGTSDTVHLGCTLNDADHDGSHGSGQSSGSTDGNCSESRGDECAARESTGAVGENAQDQ